MHKKFAKKIKSCLPASLLSILMLFSCAEGSASLKDNSINNDKDNQTITRVDFDEVIKNVNIGYQENYNESVLVSSAVSNAKVLNQEVTVIIEMEGNTTLDTYLSNKEFKAFPDFYGSKQAIRQENELIDSQVGLASQLLKAGLIDEVTGNYSTLMNGFSAKTTYKRVEEIRNFKNVKCAYVSTIYSRPQGVVSNNTNVYEDTGIYKNDTQYDGSNTIVAVLDSGFDYTHEVFQMEIAKPAKTKDDISKILENTVAYDMAQGDLTIDDVYLSSKVPFAYDYADKKADVFPIESDHGTHVSGIIGGLSDKITGIAPNTQFAWMKVFNDDDGGGDSADIISALEDAVAIGVDAINLSLGALGGYSEEVIPEGEVNSLEERTNRVYSQIEEIGISLLTAAGNEYSSGYQSTTGTNVTGNPESGTISSPGSYPASLTVASINGTLDPYAVVNNQADSAVFFKNAFDAKQVEHKFIEELFAKINNSNLTRNADGSIDIPYVTVPGNGTKANYTGLNVKGKIALVKRGNISFEEKLRYAYQAGAFACLIYNNVSGSLSITVGEEVSIPVALISQEAGTRLSQKKNGVLTFKEDYKAGPFMSDFSSWGPLPDLKLKPEITAHGGNIYSAILGGKYDLMSGTSMATPNACGIVLVIRDYVKENWPTLTPKEVTRMVNQLLMSTATICLNEVGNPYSPRKQGAGLASLLNSVTTNAYLYVDGIDKTKLELGDDKNKTGTYEATFNVRNISSHAITYDVGNLTFTETVSSDDKAVAETAYMLDPTMEVSVGAGLSLEGKTKVVVPAGADSTVTVKIKLSNEDKKYLDAKFTNGMYVEGYVTMKPTTENEVALSIPFLAFYGDWLKAPMFDASYYDVEADRVNPSISEKDKLQADMTASTPYGKYAEYYMIPLGAYIYSIDAGYEQIAATEEKAAISIDSENAIYELYTVYLGMLRGAKKLTMTITNATSGEVVFEKVTYNNRKASFYGGYGSILPYNDDYSFPMWNEETGEVFANNTKLVVNMQAELDYENGQNVSNNTFEFSFYVDYETPTLEDVHYVTEWDKTLKENRYYLELYVSDNRYVQSIRPCTIQNNTLISLVDNPIPVYQKNANESTKVRIEITDYFADLKGSEYSDTIFFMISDYALNSNIFMVSLGGCDYPDLAFNESTIEIEKNEIINLNDYVNFENATLQGMTWTSSNTDKVIVDEGQVIGLERGMAVITGTSPSYGTSISCTVKVKDNNSTNDAYITDVRFSGFTTLFSFNDDFEYSILGGVDDEGLTYSYMPASNSFEIYPSESFKLLVDVEPWYYDDSNVEIKWSSANTNYVTVTEDGVITAIKETVSPVNITATAYINGKETVFSTACAITVKDPFIKSGLVLQYYKGWGGVVEIPDDLGIEYIGEYAFSHYTYAGVDFEGITIRKPIGDNTSSPITKIIVPEGVKIIQNYAFTGLKHLEEVVLPYTAKDIYVSAFENCSSLQKINLNNINKIENFAFNECSSLSNVNRDGQEYGKDLSNVVTMGVRAFANTALTKVNLIRLRMAGRSTFEGCTSLREVTLYEDNPLSKNMFAEAAIDTITIPHGIIATNAFADCAEIKNVIFTNKELTIEDEAFKGCGNLQNITFAEDTTNLVIGYNAFEGSAIETLSLPSCNVTIKDEAFKDSSIKTVEIKANTLITFEGAPFVNVASFNEIVLDSTNPYYEFAGNQILTNETKDTIILVPANVEINIPSTIKTINDSAMAGNLATQHLVIPATVQTIENFAFTNGGFEKVTFEDVTKNTLGTYLFYGCENLTVVNGIDNLKSLPAYMFAYTGLTSISVGNDATIGYGAFAFCEDLTSVNLGTNVTIDDYAFYKSFAQNSTLTINSGSIGEFAFAETNLTTANIANVNKIGNGAFMKSVKLTDVNISNVDVVGEYAFMDCEELSRVDATNTTVIGYAAFSNDKKLAKVIATKLNRIEEMGFYGCEILDAINLSKVEFIGKYAFENCTILTEIDLSSIKTIEEGAFMNTGLVTVHNLERSSLVTIPLYCFYHENLTEEGSLLTSINLSKIEKIEEAAFYGCYSLVNVDLSSVKTVDNYAFYGSMINKIDIPNATDVGDFAFYAVQARTINIPSLVNVGECAFAETLASKVDLPSTLKTIKYGAFSSIKYVENYTFNGAVNYTCVDENNNPVWMINDGVIYTYLPNGKLQLQSYPVYNKRTSYTVLEGTQRIDAYSFYNTGSIVLEEVFFPYTLESIGDTAFGGCSSIKTYHFASYEAPTLEGIYNANLINYLASLQEISDKADKLYFVTHGTIYNMYFYYYPYFYSNFYDYVGLFNEDLTMTYPSNGHGYDSWIYRNYFTVRTPSLAVADDATNKAIAALNSIKDIDSATNDNKDLIIDVYNSYIVITDPAQLEILDAAQVENLLRLYQEVIDINNPAISEEQVKELAGTYTNTEEQGVVYTFTINENGSGTFVITDENSESQNRSFTFDKVRHSSNDALQIITNDGTTFTFTVNENNNLALRYYVFDVELTKQEVDNNEPTAPKKGCKGNVTYGLTALLALAAIMFVKKHRQTGGN